MAFLASAALYATTDTICHLADWTGWGVALRPHGQVALPPTGRPPRPPLPVTLREVGRDQFPQTRDWCPRIT